MSIQLRFRRGTTAQHSTFTGAQAEVTVDTTTNSLVVHDGVTAGGHPIASSGTLNAHVANTSNPHSVTKAQVGLGNVDNTSDANKPVSTATQTALDAKVDEDLTGYTDAGALDGTEVIFANKAGAKKSTVQKILDWIKTQANTWTAKQTISGDLEFGGAARRILGDFSNGTIANRTLFQTSTLNGLTLLGVLPNGTGSTSQCQYYNSADTTNTSQLNVGVDSGQTFVQSSRQGAGTFLPINFITSGVGRMLITAAGNVEHTNYTKLGDASPAIKVKKLTGTTNAASGGTASVAHGLTRAKILSAIVLVDDGNEWLPHSYVGATAGFQFVYFVDTTNVVVTNVAGNSGSITSKPFEVFITYEE